ncbi:probable bifunctional methylthioribulose-1-phosphate dehydratase/enolase-phosphatase E1 [Tanacetum coccineum]
MSTSTSAKQRQEEMLLGPLDAPLASNLVHPSLTNHCILILSRWMKKGATRIASLAIPPSWSLDEIESGFYPFNLTQGELGRRNKRETKSYIEISNSLGVDKPSEILFITDVVQEAAAAKAAGLEVIISFRPGNGPLPENHGFTTICLGQVMQRQFCRFVDSHLDYTLQKKADNSETGDTRIVLTGPSINDYKCDIAGSSNGLVCMIMINFGGLDCKYMEMDGLLCNGAIHWFYNRKIIASFDLSKEVFQEFPSPLALSKFSTYEQPSHYDYYPLQTTMNYIPPTSFSGHIHIWMLEEDSSAPVFVRSVKSPYGDVTDHIWLSTISECNYKYNEHVFVESLVSPHGNCNEGRLKRKRRN